MSRNTSRGCGPGEEVDVYTGTVLAATLAAAQAPGGAQEGPAPDPTRVLTAPDIPGVVTGGTKVEFIRAGFNGTEGVIAMPDGSVLFTEQDAASRSPSKDSRSCARTTW